jgi:GTP pyrophosphokinase
MESKESDDGGAIVDFVVLTQDVRHLNKMVLDLRRVNGVREVQRVQKV